MQESATKGAQTKTGFEERKRKMNTKIMHTETDIRTMLEESADECLQSLGIKEEYSAAEIAPFLEAHIAKREATCASIARIYDLEPQTKTTFEERK